VPGVENKKLNVAFVAIDPLPNSPVVLVTLCVAPSLLVQTMVVPAVTVIVAGVKAIPWIQTSFFPGPVVVPVLFFVEVLYILSIDFLHPVTLRIVKTIAILKNNLFLVPADFFIIVIIRSIEHPGTGFVLTRGDRPLKRQLLITIN
jgi:hypothetical protein